jgi:WD40-like Beta Propeller Repeat
VFALTTLVSIGYAGAKRLDVLQYNYQYCTKPSQYQYCSPDRIVYASARTAVAQLYSVKPSGAGFAQLTFGAGNWSLPVPSPDGRYVAAFRGPDVWLWDYPSSVEPGLRPELWVMQANGTDAQRLAADATGVSWSADSKRLAYASGGIWIASVNGGPPRQITESSSDGAPSLSPDGHSVAFVRAGSDPQLIISRNGHERIIFVGLDGQPFWSPDGTSIAVRGNDTISVVGTDGDLVETVPTARTFCMHACVLPVAWSPDSRLVAYGDGDGIKLLAGSGGEPRLLVDSPWWNGSAPQGLAWSPLGDRIVYATKAGVSVATLDGHVSLLFHFGPGEPQQGIGWSTDAGLSYQKPEPLPLLVQASQRELEARFPIQKFSADGDRVAYWLCPHSLGVWQPGGTHTVSLGPATLAACLVPHIPSDSLSSVYDLTLAGDRLAYLTRGGLNTWTWSLLVASVAGGDEGDVIASDHESGSNLLDPRLARLEDLLGGGSALVYGARVRDPNVFGGDPESVWRVDGTTPVRIALRPDDLEPLAFDGGRIVVRRADSTLDLLGLDGSVLATFTVPALGAALAGDDLVLLVQGQLRDYSASSGELLHAWPLPDVSSSGRCRLTSCPSVRLTLDDAARGIVVYTLDGTVHLLRLQDGADRTLPDATAAEITDAGLFYTYPGADPWPGRIRFVPFSELPL